MLTHDLATLDPEDRRFGGKARSLARLLRAGFDVPPGFVLPPDALSRPDPELVEAVTKALARLGPGPHAVRSSAAAEDSATASYAGQHLTVLGVRGPAAVLEAITRVAGSAHAAHASTYRGAIGERAAGPTAMAIVVQAQVEARAAGVAFTADPVSGDRRTVVVAAVAGLGEALVSGERSGETFRFHRHRYRYRRQGHLRLLAHAAGDEPAAAISAAEARDVARLAIEVERRLGLAPADIEWAIDRGGRVRLLQARPVTTALVRPFWFLPLRLDEMLSGPVSPLITSLFALHFGRSLPAAAEAIGFPLAAGGSGGIVRRIHGRPYLNATLLAGSQGGAGHELDWIDAVEGTGSAHERRAAFARLAIGVLPRLRPLRLLAAAQAMVFADDVRAVLERSRAVATTLGAGVPLASDAELVAIVRLEPPDLARSVVEVGSANAVSRAFGELVLRLCLALVRLAAPGAVEPTDVVGPAEGLIESELGERLFVLSRHLRDAGRGLAPLGEPGAIRDEFLAFLGEYGDRGPDEGDVAAPRWRDDPEPLRRTLLAYLGLADDQAPSVRLGERQAARRRAVAALAVALGPGARLAAIESLAALARRLSRDGENTKHEIVRVLGLVRAAVLEIGGRLVAGKALARRDDVFLLTADEIRDAVATGTPVSAELVASRRSELASAAARPPRVVDDRLRPVSRPHRGERETPAGDESASVLHGIGASPGRVTGQVRIVRSPAAATLVPGEVLVARQTDPAWTPLFLPAAAVVVEVGSLLSHASIVARELGVPSVVAVRGVLTRLQDGDWVEVDGSAGTVTPVPAGGGLSSRPR